jgi:hypothetical protein
MSMDAQVIEWTPTSVVVQRAIVGVTQGEAYDAVSDVDRMREWSPEGRGRSAPEHPLRAGDDFRGSNRRGWRRWSTRCVVIRAERPDVFAFDVSWAGMPVARWEYGFVPVEGGVIVRETWHEGRRGARGLLVKVVGLLASGVWNRAAHNAESMTITLDRLAAALRR